MQTVKIKVWEDRRDDPDNPIQRVAADEDVRAYVVDRGLAVTRDFSIVPPTGYAVIQCSSGLLVVGGFQRLRDARACMGMLHTVSAWGAVDFENMTYERRRLLGFEVKLCREDVLHRATRGKGGKS